jgi:hypothetical protein
MPIQKLSEKALQDLKIDLENIGFFNVSSQL